MIGRIVAFAGLWAVVAALGSPAEAQGLGVWQPSDDERIASGGPALDAPIAPADPVQALPRAAKPQRPAGRPSVGFSIKGGESPTLPTRPAPLADLMVRDYDPGTPLPRPGLAEMAPPESRWPESHGEGPRPYVHLQPEEHGGGVLGLNGVLGFTVPFPTSRGGDR